MFKSNFKRLKDRKCQAKQSKAIVSITDSAINTKADGEKVNIFTGF